MRSYFHTLVVLALLVMQMPIIAQTSAPPCAFVTQGSPLRDKLACTFARVNRIVLGTFLRPVEDNVVLRGTVEDTPALNIHPFLTSSPAPPLICRETDDIDFDDFKRVKPNCLGPVEADGDLTFLLLLDDESAAKLDARMRRDGFSDWWAQKNIDKTHIHVEIIMMGRNIAPGVPTRLFPGWKRGEGFRLNGSPTSYYDNLDCQKWEPKRCAIMKVSANGQVLTPGKHVAVSGALVIDCNDWGASTGCDQAGPVLEIHPAYEVTFEQP